MPRKDSSSEQPSLIRLEEVTQVEKEINALRHTAIKHLQELLERLAGRKGESPEKNKEIADKVDDLARQIGGRLISNEQPATLRWARRVYETRTPNVKETLTLSAKFPSLTVCPRELIEKTDRSP